MTATIFATRPLENPFVSKSNGNSLSPSLYEDVLSWQYGSAFRGPTRPHRSFYSFHLQRRQRLLLTMVPLRFGLLSSSWCSWYCFDWFYLLFSWCNVAAMAPSCHSGAMWIERREPRARITACFLITGRFGHKNKGGSWQRY